jgi:nicotinate-nucleotide--dimethylbenzimidazole phosphoribosyltransferase
LNSTLERLLVPPRGLDPAAENLARVRQNSLTKPPGALGQLESLVIRLAGLQGRPRPRVDRVHISVFAADHGVAEEHISAFPQAVTVEMIRNFAHGGAAISVLALALGASLEVVDLGTVGDCGNLPSVRRCVLGPGTANFARQSAMNAQQCVAAMAIGAESVERAHAQGGELFIGGEIGIGNSTSAAALACALLAASPVRLVGPGTGLDTRGVAHKADVVARALKLHAARLHDPFSALCDLGGFEIAALVGACLSCARLGLPALIDGFIASVAALLAERLSPGASAWWLFAHRSAEPGHTQVLQALQAQPILDLGLRLGEGSGAAVAVPLLRLACELHAQMASFDQAGVSGKLS